jgi:hypothetical protein
MTGDQQAAEDLPTAGDLVSGYRANYLSFPSLRLLWTQSLQFAEAYHQTKALMLKFHQARAQQSNLSPEERSDSLGQVESLKSSSQSADCDGSVLFQEFITDRSRYQMRQLPYKSLAEFPTQYTFSPPLRADSTNLATVFYGTPVTEYEPAQNIYKIWHGTGAKRGSGEFRKDGSWNLDAYLPPLGADNDGWGVLHEIDAFFRLPVSRLRVIRREVVDGATTYVMESMLTYDFSVALEKSNLATRYQGKLEKRASTRAYIDPARGFLPVRIEHGAGHYFNGRLLTYDNVPSHTVVSVTRFLNPAGGGWYPADGGIVRLTMDPTKNSSGLSLEKELEGSAKPVPLVVMDATNWKTLKIETPISSPDIFGIDFPIDTEYFDITTNKTMIRGNGQDIPDYELADEAPVTEFKAPAGRRLRLGWIVIVNIILLTILILWYWLF